MKQIKSTISKQETHMQDRRTIKYTQHFDNKKLF